jgi:aminoglycoside phosphotransferase family enzyme/predicted kinase
MNSSARSTTPNSNEQEQVFAFLADPRSYSPPVPSVERFDTHGATVFLASTNAWKIKRAVRFPYMDLSTLAKRKAACTREVEVNRGFAPEIYLGCVPITREPNGRLALGGDGDIIEWAVHMRRFDQAALLSNVAASEGISPAFAKGLADVVLESHQRGPPAAVDEGTEPFRRLIASVARTLLTYFEARHVAAFHEAALACIARARHVLDERAANGCVRRCHGDLHLRNIVLWHGRPTLFDAVEFDEDLATIDTLYDLAFLLMDIDHRGLRPAANIVLNRYLWRSNALLDLQGLRALPLFLGLRAAIRAMVTAQRAEQQADNARARHDLEHAHAFLEAARTYLEKPKTPWLIAVGGLSGTGKSTLATALAADIGAAPGAVHLRSDLERKMLFGAEETTRLGPEAYTDPGRRRVYAVLCRKARVALSADHSVIVDAVYETPEQRAEIAAVAAELGSAFVGLWLYAPSRLLAERVAARRDDASDATVQIVAEQLARETGPLSKDWHVIDAGHDAQQTLSAARQVCLDLLRA